MPVCLPEHSRALIPFHAIEIGIGTGEESLLFLETTPTRRAMGGEEKRHQMMQNLFGDQSEEEEEDEVGSEHESNRQPDYFSDEAEGEGEVKHEEQGDVEVESEGELHNVDPDPGESESERAQSSPEREVNYQSADVEEKEAESDEHEEYGHRSATGRRQSVADSESERSEDYYVGNEDEEVDQARKSRSPSIEKDKTHVSHSVAEIRDVFGDSDEEGPAEYANQNDLEQESQRSPMEEEESYENNVRPEDIVPDNDAQYDSEENIEPKLKEKPVGPPLELEIPLRPPPGPSDKMNMIRVSNIMGVEPKPFDPKTYVEDDMFVTDESGARKRIRLENNIVRWRSVRSPDGTLYHESNARFVRWSDGSLQLLIGNEVLDISVQEAEHDQAHLFLRHGKGILQSQGRLLRKMRFMPSSLTSNSHRLLTALVDSRHKKVYKVKNCVTDHDPEREKEEKEKAAGQTIRANELLHRKREKVNRKYIPKVDRGRQLSPTFLEEALDEDDEPDYYESRRTHRPLEEDLEVEAQAEKRIMNAKRSLVRKDISRKSSLSASRLSRSAVEEYSDSDRDESEYETDGDGDEDERSYPRKRVDEPGHEEEEYDGPDENEAGGEIEASEEEQEPRRGKGTGTGIKRKEVESDVDSPPRKATTAHRRMVVSDTDEDE